ncbi:protein FAR1-RELATED SEQUENCE 5-like isoform X1 [Arachis hypogaea]|uniref:protein FAR1-RELATED SEQUENCE 5-like isoform X1 n=2 Tax=Arachis hypogaea TaxID=3818 RepID=UPI000DECEC8B|nr:protein FAR1-RELATED SEQUENCE 5-like isoform X1 [Arachis hypogaea]
MCDALQVSLLEKELDRYYNNSMYAPFQEEGVVEENAASDGDDFEGVGGHSVESGAEGIDDDVYGDGFYDSWEERGIDRLTDLGCMNLKEIRADHIKMLHFADREVAFAFYNLYAKMNGFAARRYRSRRNMNNEVTQQSFVCFRQGFRKHNDCEERKREPKPETRCGCEAEMRVHVHRESGRWIIIYFQEVHNHKMLEDTLTFMLPGHRMMNAAAINQMNMMLKVGIRTPQIYASFVQTAGGHENVPFLKRDMYNQIDKQRKLIGGDAKSCLKLLESMAERNPGMFVRYLADKDGRLVHLFWSDNCSQLDFHLFGDVLAFDATYRKNKYMCPLVVFSGVNHHNQTIVFAAALVANETEETYTWLLQQFLEAMKGKAPGCVITDGHGAMKKAIEAVFPGAYHRLCAWHLIRNATSNISNPVFTSEFKKCMLFDYEVSEFEERWQKVVSELGLETNQWVCDLYAKRAMWATAYIRGHFFGGFRTTSRCEGLHSMLGKFVHSRHNLKDFVEQFFRCISQMRSREAHTDLQSIVGDLVMQTPLHALEKSAANSLTWEIFLLFRPMLSRACTLKVRSCTYTPMCKIYTLSRSRDAQREWQVSHYPNGTFFKCSCMRMESLGIPCDHIVAVLVHMDATEIPSTLVLGRWSKDARSKVRAFMEKGPFCWDSMVNCRNWMLNDLCRELCVVASNDADQFVQVTQKIRNEISRVKGSVKEVGERANVVGSSTLEECVRDPNIARQRTRRRKGLLNHPSVKGVKRCGICRKVGHNRLSCHQRQTRRESESLAARCSPSGEMYDDDDVYYEDISQHEDGDYYIPAHMTDGNVYADEDELAEQCATVEHEYDISLSEP